MQVKQAEFGKTPYGGKDSGKLADKDKGKGGGRQSDRRRSRSRIRGGKGGGRDRDRRYSRSRSRGGRYSREETQQNTEFNDRASHDQSVSRGGTPRCRDLNCGICEEPGKNDTNPDSKSVWTICYNTWECCQCGEDLLCAFPNGRGNVCAGPCAHSQCQECSRWSMTRGCFHCVPPPPGPPPDLPSTEGGPVFDIVLDGGPECSDDSLAHRRTKEFVECFEAILNTTESDTFRNPQMKPNTWGASTSGLTLIRRPPYALGLTIAQACQCMSSGQCRYDTEEGTQWCIYCVDCEAGDNEAVCACPCQGCDIDSDGWTGRALWPSGAMLATHFWQEQRPAPLRVLELACGSAALPGLTLALGGHEVTFADLPDVLPLALLRAVVPRCVVVPFQEPGRSAGTRNPLGRRK